MRANLWCLAGAVLLVTSANADTRFTTNQSVFCMLPAHRGYGDPHILVNLNVNAKGGLHWNSQEVTREVFTKYLSAAKESPHPIFIVIPEPQTTYSTLSPILRQIQEAGIERIQINNIPLEIPPSTPSK